MLSLKGNNKCGENLSLKIKASVRVQRDFSCPAQSAHAWPQRQHVLTWVSLPTELSFRKTTCRWPRRHQNSCFNEGKNSNISLLNSLLSYSQWYFCQLILVQNNLPRLLSPGNRDEPNAKVLAPVYRGNKTQFPPSLISNIPS